MWQHALMFPDADGDWSWARRREMGLPHLVRLLVTLRRAGIAHVAFPPQSETLQPWLQQVAAEKDLPHLFWGDRRVWPASATRVPVLGIRGGILFTPQLLRWFHTALGRATTGKAIAPGGDGVPVLVSFHVTEAIPADLHGVTLAQLASAGDTPALSVPAGTFCLPIEALEQPGGSRALLTAVGKPTDRWHVEWVRQWTFPALRWLARTGITPNQVSVAGFAVALGGCLVLAQGHYWSGLVGAVLLYASWVLDCMDGTLARLTLAESAFGATLDTVLGHVSNLSIFAALIWAVYGRGPLWKVAAMAVGILGGIVIASLTTTKVNQIQGQQSTAAERLKRFLAKINHRDYAVWLFLLALTNSIALFLWLSLVGVHIYWLLQLWLIRR
jgi:phosphatidylglycerophosphate synthase